MSKHAFVIVGTMMLALLAQTATAQRGGRGQRTAPNSTRAGQLDRSTRQALLEALDDERKVEAFYQAVIDKLGDDRPFSMIVKSEANHAAALESLLRKYNVRVPENKLDPDSFDVPATRAAACERAQELEKENVAMYDRLLKNIKQQDIRDVMEQLQACSQERHLPAFERCAQGGQGRGPAAGRGPGNGRGPGAGNGRGRGAGNGFGRGAQRDAGPGGGQCPCPCGAGCGRGFCGGRN